METMTKTDAAVSGGREEAAGAAGKKRHLLVWAALGVVAVVAVGLVMGLHLLTGGPGSGVSDAEINQVFADASTVVPVSDSGSCELACARSS